MSGKESKKRVPKTPKVPRRSTAQSDQMKAQKKLETLYTGQSRTPEIKRKK
jgi:hypothetical protein